MTQLTSRQQEVLDYIDCHLRERKFPPTFREISEHFKVTVRAAYEHIKALERKGAIRCDKNKSRSIEIVRDESESEGMQLVPILGTVVAGIPLASQENLDGYLPMPARFLGSGTHFALRVKGDSMRDAGICEGDLAVIRQQMVAENGDIVVAMIDEAITIKRFFKEANRIHLKAENPAYHSIFTREAKILGKLAHLIRSY